MQCVTAPTDSHKHTIHEGLHDELHRPELITIDLHHHSYLRVPKHTLGAECDLPKWSLENGYSCLFVLYR